MRHIRLASRQTRAGVRGRLGPRDERGFTLVEMLAAVALLVIAMIGLLTSMSAGVTDVDAARRSTAALFLAEQRMEEIKAFAMSKDASRGWINVTTAQFGNEAYGTIAGYPDYRRTVTVTDVAADTKQVVVQVFYRPVTTTGLNQETSVVVSTLLANR